MARRITEQTSTSPFRAIFNTAYAAAFGKESKEEVEDGTFADQLSTAIANSLREVIPDNNDNNNNNNPGIDAQFIRTANNPDEPNDDDNSASISSTDSDSTMGSSEEEKATSKELKQRMEKKENGCTEKVKNNPDYAQFVHFRNTMGGALSTYECDKCDLGYSYLADMDAMHQRCSGKTTAPPAMPGRPDEKNEFHAGKDMRKKYKKDLKYFKACMHARKAGIEVLEEMYPKCLALLHDPDVGLPLYVSLKDALEHVQAAIDTPQRKREENLVLQKQARTMSDSNNNKSNMNIE